LKKEDSQISKLPQKEFGRIFIISFGVFLFILFFQPFPLETLDFNNRLLYVAGFGGISFFVSVLILIGMPLALPKWFKTSMWETGPPFILNSLLLVLTATAFAFYIRFVGNSNLSLYILFKIALVCLIPVIILVILYKNKYQERTIDILREQNKAYLLTINEFEQIKEEKEIEIFSSSKTNSLIVAPNNIISIQSADNYIEIYYLNRDIPEKKLIRNTLKDIELQLTKFKNIIRCHRTCLVNVHFIDKISRNSTGYYLKISEINKEFSVSRQYVIHLKNALATLK
jgi:DNA-binding LytR/AlgR family response regulator